MLPRETLLDLTNSSTSIVVSASQSLDQKTSSIVQNAAGTQAVGYSTVAALAFLLYDILLTFGDEVKLIWPNPWAPMKVLFFFIRYFPVMLEISIMFIGTPPFTFSAHACYIWNVYQGLASVLIIFSVDYILILRVCALYPRNKAIRVVIAALYLAEIVTMSLGIGLSVPRMVFDEFCTIIDAPITLLISAGAPIAFQAVLFVCTGWKFMQAVRAGWGNVPIVKLLMRDGTWAFILIFAVFLSEAALYGFATEAYTGILYGWLNTTFSFCGYRILLNINSLNRPRRPSTFNTGPDIQFTTNVYTGEQTDDSFLQMTVLSDPETEVASRTVP